MKRPSVVRWAEMIAVAILMPAAVSLVACKEQTPPPDIPPPVRLATVDFYHGDQGSRYSASVIPYSQVDLSFQSAGYITSIKMVRGHDGRVRMVQQGDYVTRGTVLAVVDQRDYTDKLNQAKASLERAQADFQRAQLTFQRTSALYDQQSATKSEYDDAQAQNDANAANVKNAQAAVSFAQTALGYCSLAAPMDGWIVNRNVDVGSLVGASTVGFTMVDTHLVKIEFGVPDISIGLVKLGSTQNVTLDAVSGVFTGHITSISPAADPKSRVYTVEVTLPNPDNQLRAGMIATLVLPGATPAFSVLTIPLSAVVRPPDAPPGFYAFTFDGNGNEGVARRRLVQIGDPYGNQVAVMSGLTKGDRVIASGATLVRDGQTVQVIP